MYRFYEFNERVRILILIKGKFIYHNRRQLSWVYIEVCRCETRLWTTLVEARPFFLEFSEENFATTKSEIGIKFFENIIFEISSSTTFYWLTAWHAMFLFIPNVFCSYFERHVVLWCQRFKYSEDLEKQERWDVVAHERLTEPLGCKWVQA